VYIPADLEVAEEHVGAEVRERLVDYVVLLCIIYIGVVSIVIHYNCVYYRERLVDYVVLL
jgi:hypothetical protein